MEAAHHLLLQVMSDPSRNKIDVPLSKSWAVAQINDKNFISTHLSIVGNWGGGQILK
jgi:hypothetical protein